MQPSRLLTATVAEADGGSFSGAVALRLQRWRWTLAVPLATLALAAACSGSDASAPATLGSEEAADTTLTTPTTEAATTLAPTTAPPPEPPTLEERLLAFHHEFLVEQSTGDTRETGYDDLIAWAEENTTGRQRERQLGNYAEQAERGIHQIGPGTISNVTNIEWEGDGQLGPSGPATVTVTDCSLDRLEIMAADGTELYGRANIFSPVSVEYTYIGADDPADERWFAEQFTAPANERCDPVDLILADPDEPHTDEADAARAVHDRFLAETFGGIDERVEGYEATLASLAETATTTAVDQITRIVESNREKGLFMDGAGWDNHVAAVRVTGDTAAVVACALDVVAFVDADDEIIAPSGENHELVASFLTKVDDEWRVEFFWRRGDQPCNPADY